MHFTDKKEFFDWYKEFVKDSRTTRYGEKWFDRVEQSHQNIRNALGGIRKIVEVPFKDIQVPVDFAEIDKITHEMLVYIPGYFAQYKLVRRDFCISTVNKGNQFGMKWGKHIQHWMKANNCDEELVTRINNLVSRLGDKWSKAKTSELKMYVNITTSPQAFILLGHYGEIDQQSCFRHGSSNHSHKYILAQSPNSYVILVSTSPDIEGANLNTLQARFWGVANADLTRWSVANYYARKHAPEGNIYQAVERLYAEILGCDKPKRTENQLTINGAFQNKLVNWVFLKPPINPATVGNTEYRLEQGFIGHLVQCLKCGNSVTAEDAVSHAGRHACLICETNLPVCELTGRKTAAVYEVIHSDGKQYKICYELFSSGDYLQDSIDLKYYHKDLMVYANNEGWICRQTAENLRLTECPVCHKFIHWSHFREHNGVKKCQNCIKADNLLSSKKAHEVSIKIPPFTHIRDFKISTF